MARQIESIILELARSIKKNDDKRGELLIGAIEDRREQTIKDSEAGITHLDSIMNPIKKWLWECLPGPLGLEPKME